VVEAAFFNPAAAKRKTPVEYPVLLPGFRDLPQPTCDNQFADCGSVAVGYERALAAGLSGDDVLAGRRELV
jgi:hypothetical protein